MPAEILEEACDESSEILSLALAVHFLKSGCCMHHLLSCTVKMLQLSIESNRVVNLNRI